MLTGADWKAHHRETNHLLGLFWDFIDKVPTVLALFYRNDLTQQDWGAVIVPTTDQAPEIIENVEEGMEENVTVEVAVGAPLQAAQPKKRKGRMTSVSIMTSSAVEKMGKAWIVIPTDPELLAGLCKRAVFDLGLSDVASLTSDLPAVGQETLKALDRERHGHLEKLAGEHLSDPALSRKKRDGPDHQKVR